MALNDDIEILAAQPLLGLMPREALRLIAFAAETRILRAGDILFRKGEPAEGAYIIMRGSIVLDERNDGSPGQMVCGPGTLIGETALFTAVARPATALAREPATVARLTRVVMHRVLGEFPDAATIIHAAIAERVSQFARSLKPVGGALRALD